MSIYQKLYQVEYLVKKAIEEESVHEKQELLLKLGSVLEIRVDPVKMANLKFRR